MCRLFPPELIDSIAAGTTPDPRALERIAAHIESDLRTSGASDELEQGAILQFCRTFARAALTWSAERQVADPPGLAV